MAIMRYVLFGCLVATIAGCSSKPKDLIIGKWKGPENKDAKSVQGTIEFTSDGKVIMSAEGKSLEGKYKFLDDNNMELEASMLGKSMTKKVKIESITKEKLVTSDSEGRAEFSRVK
jgi:uncharacterized protein (TIGR03066 family)